jgi:MraZ protein
MFLGEYEHSLDEKGRLAIPARFREELGEIVYVTRGFDRCLMGFTREKWEELSQQVSQLAVGARDARDLRRLLFSNAAELQPDRQGRILIPQNLREYANLGEQVILAGLSTYFEIWSSERWQEVLDKIDDNGSVLAEQLAALGI